MGGEKGREGKPGEFPWPGFLKKNDKKVENEKKSKVDRWNLGEGDFLDLVETCITRNGDEIPELAVLNEEGWGGFVIGGKRREGGLKCISYIHI